MYCTYCGRKHEEYCSCIRSTTYGWFDYSVLLLMMLLMPGVFLARAFFHLSGPLPFFEIGLISMNIMIISFTVHDLFSKKHYLPLLFGCHQKIERSFQYKTIYLPLCARCSGLYVGIVLSSIFLWISIDVVVIILLSIPLLVDGVLQRLSNYTSNHLKRFITGVLFAPLLVYLFSLFHYFLFQSVLWIYNFLL